MWECLGVVVDSKPIFIEGYNVWDYKWENMNKKVKIKDQLYNETKIINLWSIKVNENKEIRFAAGEFSNCIWGFYIWKNNC